DDRETLVSEHKHKGKTCRQSAAVFNVVNSIIGNWGKTSLFACFINVMGGTFFFPGLPYSMKQAGFPLGILLLFWVSYVTDFSLILLIKGAALSGTDTYQSLVNRTFGFPGYLLLSVLQFLYPFIVDPENLLIGRHFIIVLSTVVFTLPLSLYRDIAKLGKVIFTSLEEPTVAKWSHIIHVSTLISVFISILFATCGYLTFTGYTQGDLFENYCRNDDLVTFGRFCYGVTVILTYPIECFVTREVIANVFFGGNLSSVFHIIITVVIITVATLVSLLVDCLGIVLELNGVLCAAPLIFIVPSACYLKLSEEPRTHSDKIMSCVMLPIGAVVMAVGFVMAVTSPQDCSHGQEMFYCSLDNFSLTNISISHFQLTTQLSILNVSIFQ
ncbi:hypothetical protein MJG53_020446, partial [Ovis ammon polii x Ovis aries]